MDPALLGAGAEEDARRFDHAVSRFTDELIGLMPEGRGCLESYVRAQCCLLVDEKVRLFREAAARRERQLSRRQGEKTRAVQKLSDLKEQQHAQEVRRLTQQLRTVRASRPPAVDAALAAAQRSRDGASAHLLFLLWRAAAGGCRGAVGTAKGPAAAQDSERAKPVSKASYRWRGRAGAKENDPPGNGACQEDGDGTFGAAPWCGSAPALGGARLALGALGVQAAVALTPTPLLSSSRTLSTDASKDSLQQTSRALVEVPVECTAQLSAAGEAASWRCTEGDGARGPPAAGERLSRIPSVPRGLGSAPASGSGTPVAGVPSLPPWAAACGGGPQLQRCPSSRSWTPSARTDQSGPRDPHRASSVRLEPCDASGDSRRSSNSQGAAQPPALRPDGHGQPAAPLAAPPAPAASPPMEMRRAPAGRGSPAAERPGLGGGSLASAPPLGAAPAAGRQPPPPGGVRQLPSAGSSLALSVGAESPRAPPPQRAPRAGSPPASGRGLRPACAPPGGAAAQGLALVAPGAWRVALAHAAPPGGGAALPGSLPGAPVAVVHSQVPAPSVAPGRGVLRTPSAMCVHAPRGSPLHLTNVFCVA